jgi:hypothetical protein
MSEHYRLLSNWHSFNLAMEPQELTSSLLDEVVEWGKTNRPQWRLKKENDYSVEFYCDQNDDTVRATQAFLGHMVLKFAKQRNLELG